MSAEKSVQASIDDLNRWRDPLPLATKTAALQYPIQSLPDTIRNAVLEVQSFTKAPVAMVASSALSAVSLVAQSYANVRRATKLEGPIGLFSLTIADSGERKSTCDGFFTSAIRQFENEQVEAAKPLLRDFEAAKASWTAKEAGLKEKIRALTKHGKSTHQQEAQLRDLQNSRPAMPKIAKMIRGDDTPENLAWSLSQEWPSVGVISSEAGLILGSHGMGKDSIMRNLAQLNVLWDGGVLSVGRRTSESFDVRGARLTIGLQIQEPTLRSFFDRSGGLARGTGFLARFLVAWPESTQGFRYFTEPPQNWPALEEFNRRITAILATPVQMNADGTLEPRTLDMSPGAKSAWIDFHDRIERDLAAGQPLFDVRDVASKAADNAARLAALFHLFEGERDGAISFPAFLRASSIVGWHLSESRRFFGELAIPAELANAGKLDAWLFSFCKRERKNVIPPQRLQQFGPSSLRDRQALEKAVEVLTELQRARMAREGRTRCIEINPILAAPIILGLDE